MVADLAVPKVFTLSEVAAHNKLEDLWIAYQGKVYDITEYPDHHPGGAPLLVEVAGTDATAAFEDVGHSEDAYEMLERFEIGVLAEQDRAAARAKVVYESKVIKVVLPPPGPPGPPRPPMTTQQKLMMMAYMKRALLRNVGIALVSMVAARLLWPETFCIAGLKESYDGISLFWKGFFVPCVVSLGGYWSLLSIFEKSINTAKNFRMFPPVMPPTKPIRGPPSFKRAEVITPREFRPLKLTSREKLSRDSYKFVFSFPEAAANSPLGLPLGQHIQIRAEINGEIIQRSYTPTSSNDQVGRMELTIKVYSDGKMGNYLLNLPLDSDVDIRGPNGAFKNYHRFMCDNMGMVAGGSGITPMFQLLKGICKDPLDKTRVTLIYANRTEEDILLRPELDELARNHPEKLSVHYFINSLADGSKTWTAGDVGYINLEKMQKYLAPTKDRSKYLVCGPPSMLTPITNNLIEMGADQPKIVKDSTDQVFVF